MASGFKVDMHTNSQVWEVRKVGTSLNHPQEWFIAFRTALFSAQPGTSIARPCSARFGRHFFRGCFASGLDWSSERAVLSRRSFSVSIIKYKVIFDQFRVLPRISVYVVCFCPSVASLPCRVLSWRDYGCTLHRFFGPLIASFLCAKYWREGCSCLAVFLLLSVLELPDTNNRIPRRPRTSTNRCYAATIPRSVERWPTGARCPWKTSS